MPRTKNSLNSFGAPRPLLIVGTGLYLLCLLVKFGWLPQGRDGYTRRLPNELDFDHVVWCATHSASLTCIAAFATWCVLGTGEHWRRCVWLTAMIGPLHLFAFWKSPHFPSIIDIAETDTVLILTVLLTWLRVAHGWQFTWSRGTSDRSGTSSQYQLRTLLTIVTLLGFGLAFAKQIDWVFELMRARTILRIIWVGGLVTSFLPGMLVCMGMRTWRRILALTIYWLLLPVAWAWGLFWAMAPHRLGDLVVTEIVATCWVAAVGAVVCSWVLRASGLRLASLPWSVEKRWLKRR